MGIDVSLMGMGDLIDELETNVASAAAAENEALKKAAEPVLNEAKQTAAFKDHTHKLRDSLTTSHVKFSLGSAGRGRHQRYIMVGSFDDSVKYALEVEYGHSVVKGKKGSDVGYAAAHPFLQPALINHEAEATEIIRRKLEEALK